MSLQLGLGNITELQTEKSVVAMLHLDSVNAYMIGGTIGFLTFAGWLIKFLFMYYVKYVAPKDRPINKMIFFDQVSAHQCVNLRIFKRPAALRLRPLHSLTNLVVVVVIHFKDFPN